jgi:hypothetical protein
MILIDDDRSVEATAVKDERIRKLFDHDGEVLEIGRSVSNRGSSHACSRRGSRV